MGKELKVLVFMSGIFPIKEKPKLDLDDPNVVELGSEKAEVVLDALSSKTTRDIFLRIYEEPSPVSEIAEETGSSIQNVKYHVDKLKKSGLIEITGTWYSETGNEMNVYAPKDEAIVFVASTHDLEKTLHRAIKTIGSVIGIAILGVLAINSFVGLETGGIQLATVSAEKTVGFGPIELPLELSLPLLFILGIMAGVIGMIIARKI